MKLRSISLPELGMIAGTRMALGAGIALLIGGRLSSEERRAVGWTLFGIGVISTIPLAAEVFFRDEKGMAAGRRGSSDSTLETAQATTGRW
jgi:hypothetical protein